MSENVYKDRMAAEYIARQMRSLDENVHLPR